ncbi:hypothetical protein IFM89_037574 [Coptis chinensis]|uniref:S-protein homolog n=1 Tax=Coptis chinensis TaxID=261450 RepID=A0A835LPY3_9MAGN|nr:hypothetical protein IFM89_037574 [Coptis chinensis]
MLTPRPEGKAMQTNFNNVSRAFKLLLVSVALCECSAVYGRVHVYLKNEIGPKVALNFRCQSKDNNLGDHILYYGQTYTWSFGDQIFGRTLYWCRMHWLDSKKNIYIEGTFDIYKTSPDKLICGSNCTRVARSHGVYANNYGQEELFLYYEWPRQKYLMQQNQTKA